MLLTPTMRKTLASKNDKQHRNWQPRYLRREIKAFVEHRGKFEDTISQVLGFSELLEYLTRWISVFLLQERAHFPSSVDVFTTWSKEVLDRVYKVEVFCWVFPVLRPYWISFSYPRISLVLML